MTNNICQFVTDGRSEWDITIPEDSNQVVQFAAEEVSKYLKQISRCDLEICIGTGDSANSVLLGLRSELRNVDLPEPKPGYDGYTIVVSNDSIIIAGDNDCGVIYGVYDFLEKLGCRWFQPTLDTEDPEVVPESKTLSLPIGIWVESARVHDRCYWIASLAFEIVPENAIAQIDWAAKNRYNLLSWQCEMSKLDEDLQLMDDSGILTAIAKRGLTMHGPGHSFPYFLRTKDHFEKHPEWFGFRHGKRQPHDNVWPGTVFCMSHEKPRQEFINNVVAFAKKHPQFTRLNVLPSDGARPCECERCKGKSPDLMISLFNDLAKQLRQAGSDAVPDIVPGYCPIEEVPTEVSASDEIQATYAHWGRHHSKSYDDADYHRRPNLLVWASHFKRFSVCSYYAANSHQPFTAPPFLHAIAGDTKFVIEKGFIGHFVLEYPLSHWWNNSFNIRMGALHPYYYPERDPKSEIIDYAMRYFGPKAGSLLKEYFLMMGDNSNLDKVYQASRGEASEPDLEWLREMQKIIFRAARIVKDNPTLSYRVSKLAAGMEMLLCLGPAKHGYTKAEEAHRKFQAGEATIEEVKEEIASAREYAEKVLQKGAQLSEQYPGCVGTKWIEGWTVNRTILEPLKEIEKQMAGSEKISAEEKPEFVVDTDL